VRAEFPAEKAFVSQLNELWKAYEPYADPDFKQGFAGQSNNNCESVAKYCDNFQGMDAVTEASPCSMVRARRFGAIGSISPFPMIISTERLAQDPCRADRRLEALQNR
jgi:hypothetical protein